MYMFIQDIEISDVLLTTLKQLPYVHPNSLAHLFHKPDNVFILWDTFLNKMHHSLHVPGVSLPTCTSELQYSLLLTLASLLIVKHILFQERRIKKRKENWFHHLRKLYVVMFMKRYYFEL